MSKVVLVTGANGNLGGKLVNYLTTVSWCEKVVAVCYGGELSLVDAVKDRASIRSINLAIATKSELLDLMEGVDAVVHLAAQHPYPTATWLDATVSFDISLKILDAAEANNVSRLVFASSNHVMGGYKELYDDMKSGELTVDLMPLPGTVTKAPDGSISSSIAYATAKLTGERVYLQRANAAGGRLSTVSLRIGWCQAGANLASSISATGLSDTAVDMSDPVVASAQRWFKGMWLSNRDFLQLMQCSLLSDAGDWPSPGIIANGMSANSGMVWDIETTKLLLRYSPKDDAGRS